MVLESSFFGSVSLWLWGEMLMLMLFGLIWLPRLLETTCSLLFLLYSPECTFWLAFLWGQR